MQELLTPQEVAHILKKTRRTIYNYIRAGQLPAAKVGNDWRIHPDDLDAFLKDAYLEARKYKHKDTDE